MSTKEQLTMASAVHRTITRKLGGSDDLQSKATEYTDESTVSPSPVDAAMHPSRRSAATGAGSASADVATTRPQAPIGAESSEGGDPAGRSRSIPVVRSTDAANAAAEESDEYLQRMYDSRTWEMYRRITEARKRNSSYASQQAAGAAGKHAGCDHQENASDWENMNHDFGLDGSNTPDGHEMIFLFDFE